MKFVTNYYIFCIAVVLFCGTIAPPANAQETTMRDDSNVVSDFEKRVDNYIKLREKIESTLPRLSSQASPIEIDQYEQKLAKLIQEARGKQVRGNVFTPAAEEYFRRLIKENYEQKDRTKLKQTVLTADTKEVPLKVNVSYPDHEELVEMPPKLLLTLPVLPEQLRYRFVRKHLLIVDRESRLIIDFMANAIP